MREIVRKFADIVDDPETWLAAAKGETNRKIIGCFPLYVPHELVHAAGMWPIDLYGGQGTMAAAEEVLQRIVCYPVRSAFESLLSGRLAAVDGIVMATVCTAASIGIEVWRDVESVPFWHQLVLPHASRAEASLAYLTRQLERLRSSLGEFAGTSIDDGVLAASVELYNQSRVLLQRLARASHDAPDVLPPQELGLIRAAGSFVRREDYVRLLSGLASELEITPNNGKPERVGIVLAGALCDVPQFEILSMIHEAGGAIVEDDTPFGRRLLLPVPTEGDPLKALALRYINSPPCPTKNSEGIEDNFDYIVDLVKSAGAQGVVFLRPLYCELAGLDYPILSGRLDQAGIPNLRLDIDGREVSGQVQTRLHAFIDMLRR